MRLRIALSVALLFSCATASPTPDSNDLGPPPTHGEPLQLVVQKGHSDSLRSVAFSPDGRFVATAGRDGSAKLWETSTGFELRLVRGHADDVFAVAFTPDGQSLLTGGEDGTAKLWDVTTGALIRTFSGHTNAVLAAAISGDGHRVLTASMDKTVRVWDAATGAVVTTLQGTASRVAISPDGSLALTSDMSQKSPALLWDLATGRVLHELRTDPADYVESVTFSPDGRQALIANGDNLKTADLWDVATGEHLRTFSGHTRGVSQAVFSTDGQNIVTASWDTTAMLWNAGSGEPIRTFTGHTGIVNAVATSADGRFIVTGGGDKSAKLWDLASGKELRTFGGFAHRVNGVAYSEDGRRVATANSDKTASVWDLTTGKLIHTLMGHTADLAAVAFSPDGSLIATAGYDRTTRLWDAATGAQLKSFSARAAWFKSVTFAADGKRLIVGDNENNVHIWDVATGEEVRTLAGSFKNLFAVRNVSGGRRIYLPQGSKSAALFDVETGEKLESQLGHDPSVSFLAENAQAISPDGALVAVDLYTKGVVVLDIATGKLVRKLDPHYAMDLSHNSLAVNAIEDAAFSPDGKLLVAGSTDGIVRVWDLTSGELIHQLTGHGDIIRSVAFSPDGRTLLSGSDDATTRLWDVATWQPKCVLISLEHSDWAISTPEGYYASSRTAVKGVHFVRGMSVYTFENFDLLYNRPDFIVKKIGLASPTLVSAYRLAYLKRLKKMGFTEDQISLDAHLPELSLGGERPIETNQRSLSFTVNASDSKYRVDRINVSVNDVPVFGSQGLSVRDQKSAQLKQTVTLDLSEGSNKIQVSVLNSAGVESLKQTFATVYSAPPTKHDLYVVAVGVSDYQDAAMNLTYASKDARDLATLLQADQEAFHEVKVLTVLDKDATREAILKSRTFLQQSGIDDEVVLFVAGHGLLNDRLDWYFGTHDVDFAQPERSGVSYDDLEGLLDGIPARHKLLLMDACNSGEVDKPDSELVVATQSGTGSVKSRGFKGVKSKAPAIGLLNSFELMQELFANLERGSGAIVISSASGAEFAYESPEWNNGVFTYAILSGLKSHAADANKDGRVTTAELREFVKRSVAKLTNGRQHPTSRQGSSEFDFRVY